MMALHFKVGVELMRCCRALSIALFLFTTYTLAAQTVRCSAITRNPQVLEALLEAVGHDEGAADAPLGEHNNPLRYIDPTGEKVYVGNVTGSDRDDLLKRMNSTYGCRDCVSVDKDGYLAVDTSNLSNSVATATADLTGAINSTDWYAEVRISNNDPNVSFGETRPVRGSVPWINGRRNADLIVLDLADNRHVQGDATASSTFTNTVLAHEILHRYPTAIFDPQGSAAFRNTGPVVDAVNRITSALGLPSRATYSTQPLLQGTRAQTYVQKTGSKEQRSIIYWQSNLVGGKN